MKDKKENYNEIINYMTDDLYKKLKRIPEIVEAIEICKKIKFNKKKVNIFIDILKRKMNY